MDSNIDNQAEDSSNKSPATEPPSQTGPAHVSAGTSGVSAPVPEDAATSGRSSVATLDKFDDEPDSSDSSAAATGDPTVSLKKSREFEVEDVEEPEPDQWAGLIERMNRKVKMRELPKMLASATKFVWETARGFFLISIGLQILNATGAAAVLITSKDALSTVLNAAQNGDSLTKVLPSLAPIAVVRIFTWCTGTLQMLQNGYVQERVTMLAQGRMLRTAKAVDLRTFEDPTFYDLLQRAQGGVHSGWQLVMSTVSMLGNALTIVAVVGTLYTFHPMLVFLVVIASIPLWVTNHRNARRSYDLSRDLITDHRRLGYYWQILTGRDEAKEMRAFDLGPDVEKRWQDLNLVMIRRQRRMAIEQHFRSLAGSLMSGALNSLTVGYALWLLLSGKIATAAAGAALYGIQAMRGQVGGLLGGITGLYSQSLFLKDYEEFLKIGEEAIKRQNRGPSPEPFKTLEIENLTFSYPGSHTPALSNVSLEIKAGEMIGLVGENGSGKTTLAKLLAQLYSPTEGKILWDGVDTRQLNTTGMRDSIAVIFQDFVRYHLTAQENIGFGRISNVDDMDNVIGAADRSGASKFLSKLPDGYDTMLTRVFNHGRDLSIGQWQRVALARAFFRDAQFIILDEPTAALDPRAEHDLYEKIRQLCAGRTVVLISHRFSSVRNADKIFVLEHGHLVEQGNHQDLMANDGLYAELFTMQASAYIDGLKLNEVSPKAGNGTGDGSGNHSGHAVNGNGSANGQASTDPSTLDKSADDAPSEPPSHGLEAAVGAAAPAS